MEQETEYWVRIKAINDAGESPWSEPILSSTIAEPEEILTPEEATNNENEKPVAAAQLSDGAFYGIFFTGGIIIVSVACMFAMRLV